MTDISKMLEQAQKMQNDVQKAQSELSEMEVSYSCNGVDVVANGDFSIKSITISDDLASSQDKEMIEDVVLVAVNGAVKKVRVRTESKLAGITGGLNIPGLF